MRWEWKLFFSNEKFRGRNPNLRSFFLKKTAFFFWGWRLNFFLSPCYHARHLQQIHWFNYSKIKSAPKYSYSSIDEACTPIGRVFETNVTTFLKLCSACICCSKNKSRRWLFWCWLLGAPEVEKKCLLIRLCSCKKTCLKMVFSHNGLCGKNFMSQNGHVS